MPEPTKCLWNRLVIHSVSSQGIMLDLIAAESLGCPVKRHRLYVTHADLLDMLTMVERHRSPGAQQDPYEEGRQ